MVPSMPPNLQHWHLLSPVRHKTDALRRLIHALDAQRILVFMNWQSRLQVSCSCCALLPPLLHSSAACEVAGS